MIKLTLDNSCVDENSIGFIKELIKLKNEGFIELYLDTFTQGEFQEWKDTWKIYIQKLINDNFKMTRHTPSIPIGVTDKEIINNPNLVYDYVDLELGYSITQLGTIHTKINKIMNPEGYEGKKSINKYVDEKILAKHIAEGRNIFVTNDNDYFVNSRKEKLEKESPSLKIRRLDKSLIEELKSASNLIS